MRVLDGSGQQQQQSSGRSLLHYPHGSGCGGMSWVNSTSSGGGGSLSVNCNDLLLPFGVHLPRSLLQQPSSSDSNSSSGGSGGDSPAGANAAVSGYGSMLLTAATTVRCQNLLRLGGGEELWQDDDCTVAIRAAPGQPFGRSFVLLDGLGDPISTGIYDAGMPMAVSAEMPPVNGASGGRPGGGGRGGDDCTVAKQAPPKQPMGRVFVLLGGRGE
jgi:hypothetical protein